MSIRAWWLVVVPWLVLGTPAHVAAQPPAADPFSVFDSDVGPPPQAPRSRTAPKSDIDRALEAKDWERAERLLAAEIERRPEARELLLTIASVFMRDRKPLNAAIALKKAEKLAPLDNYSRLQLALAYIAMGRADWARPELETLARNEPGNMIHAYWLARLDYDAGQYAAAVERLRRSHAGS